MNTTTAIAGACKSIICMLLSCWSNCSNKMPEVFFPSQTVHPWFHLLYVVPHNKEGNCQKLNLVDCQIQKNPKGEHNCQMLQVLIKCMLTEFHCSCRQLHFTCPVTKGKHLRTGPPLVYSAIAAMASGSLSQGSSPMALAENIKEKFICSWADHVFDSYSGTISHSTKCPLTTLLHSPTIGSFRGISCAYFSFWIGSFIFPCLLPSSSLWIVVSSTHNFRVSWSFLIHFRPFPSPVILLQLSLMSSFLPLLLLSHFPK